ncbi:ATPase synthesis protein 25, mitochondrial [Blastomyces gilchristii SLH14081]|uniref:ATPase synthesis protein 25, mitochondrial n=1 Tax=Blastomyces gilchristii (strain SLH14081) TaxID=559298 RepID=ATP25_BLAGS|nr:ATPase synthesis protein 25, mitochondrial [Blastomyces gilchristii SLH14081]C5JJY8.1 RecName: Full=ATPase synthesis protein 25, mitochondrial; Flags: Precursor [Blastomyces gilchristii SLH14081]OAT06615.1 ATPase synthesis protein 25, mitochondrial [Blastomyces gilchristii SLH14081]
MRRALLTGIQCHACRNNVVRSFVSVSGVTFMPLASGSWSASQTRPPPLSRNFSSQHAKLFSSHPSDNAEVAVDPMPEKDITEETVKPPEEPEEHIPWYLQEELEATTSHPLRKQQPLPPLPENPPPILNGLLEHISIDLGLDDISLLDLRKLDPPPALGANLIMIFGTARGVKHLNVSADRLCRWLRTTYKLRPDADGLLGRNELKIKLRRKARRAKLAKSAKSTLTAPDDGITTGWICVDVGTVEGGQFRKPEEEARKVGFVGFGTFVQGTRIVVQLMTEEKREEVDLEGLWRRTLERNSLENEGLPQPQAEEPPQEAGDIHKPSSVTPAHISHRVSHAAQISVNYEQRRGISTGSRQNRDLEEDGLNYAPINPDGTIKLPELISESTPLTSLTSRLRNISPYEAIYHLGQDVNDTNSTTFLEQFYRKLSKAPDDLASAQRIKLICIAIMLHHPGYGKTDLFKVTQEHFISNYGVTPPQFLEILDALLSFKPDLTSDPPNLLLPAADMELALQTIDHVGLRGIDLLNSTVWMKLFVGASFRVPVCPVRDLMNAPVIGNRTPVSLDTYETVNRVQTRLLKVKTAAKIELSANEYLSLLRVLFDHEWYSMFWDTWEEIALAGMPRDKSLYVFLFQLHAESDGWEGWKSTLLNCIPMMERENPPVYMDRELAEVIARCLAIAHPEIMDRVERNEPSPLVRLWHRCRIAVEKEVPLRGAQNPPSTMS